MENKSQRIYWADYVKAFSIICVVLHHTQIVEPWNSVSYKLCLAAFFFISGMFMPTHLEWKRFAFLRAKQLLLPYAFFGCVSYFIWYFIGRKVGVDTDLTTSWWEPIVGLIIGTRNSLCIYPPLWFLPSLFISEIIVISIHSLCKKAICQWFVLLLCAIAGFGLAYMGIILPWGITSSLIMASIVALGQCLHLHKSTYLQKISTLQLVSVFGSCCALFALFYILNPYTEISCGKYGNPVFFILNAIIVSFLWTSLSILIERHTKPLPVLAFLGRSTLVVLCLHIHVFGLIKAFSIYCLRLNISAFDGSIGKIILCGITIPVILVVYYLFQKLFHA